MDTASHVGLNYNFDHIDRITGNYDLIIMQEVIEHLPLATGYHYMKKAFHLLKPQGWFVVSTPNIRRPVRFHSADFSHVQHYPLKDLYGILRVIGFSSKVIFRLIEIRPQKENLSIILRREIQRLLFRLLDFSTAHSILIKIQKQ